MKELLPKKSSKKIPVKKLGSSDIETVLPTNMVVEPEVQEAMVGVCDRVGATREHCIRTLYEATLANKVTVNKYGEEIVEADFDKRIKGSLGLLEIRGDIKNKDAVKTATYNTVVYQWRKE